MVCAWREDCSAQAFKSKDFGKPSERQKSQGVLEKSQRRGRIQGIQSVEENRQLQSSGKGIEEFPQYGKRLFEKRKKILLQSPRVARIGQQQVLRRLLRCRRRDGPVTEDRDRH